jgi:N-carbamoyl-L-amino-acid hydrolase
MAQVIPGSRNVVPGRVECSVEFRHPQSSALEAMEQALHRAATRWPDAACRRSRAHF